MNVFNVFIAVCAQFSSDEKEKKKSLRNATSFVETIDHSC